VLADFLVDQDI